MNFSTRFGIGDKIYIIHTERRPTVIPCPRCNGELKVVDGYECLCTFCKRSLYDNKFSDGSPSVIWGEKSTIVIPFRHNWDNNLRGQTTHEIGKIIINFTGRDYDRYNKKEEGYAVIQYMCVETGVGSGTLWSEKDCFASEEEAQAECDKRNALSEQKESVSTT